MHESRERRPIIGARAAQNDATPYEKQCEHLQWFCARSDETCSPSNREQVDGRSQGWTLSECSGCGEWASRPRLSQSRQGGGGSQLLRGAARLTRGSSDSGARCEQPGSEPVHHPHHHPHHHPPHHPCRLVGRCRIIPIHPAARSSTAAAAGSGTGTILRTMLPVPVGPAVVPART